MTYANFKDATVSYMNRAAAAVVTAGAQDLVLVAMNDARRQAQLEYAFEGNATQAFVSLSMIPKSLLTDFKTTPGGATAVAVKRVDALYDYNSTTVGATTVYYPAASIELRRRASIRPYMPHEPWSSWPSPNALDRPSLSTFAYLQGTNIIHTNLTTATTVMADIIAFLADHDGGATEDVFLTYYATWLKFATLANLNIWLKDSERTVIDQSILSSLWQGVKTHDSQQAISTDDLSLD